MSQPQPPGMPLGRVVGGPPRKVEGPLGPRNVTPAMAEAAAALAADAKKNAELATGMDETEAERPQAPATESEEPEAQEFRHLIQQMQELKVADPEWAVKLNYLESEARRKKIEARCKPIDFDEALLNGGEFRQEVPLWGDDKPVLELRSLSGLDHLVVRAIVAEDFQSPMLIDTATTFLTTAAGVIRLGQDHAPELPSKQVSSFSDMGLKAYAAAMRQRALWLLRRAYDISWDFHIQHVWFQARYRDAMCGKDSPFRPVDPE